MSLHRRMKLHGHVRWHHRWLLHRGAPGRLGPQFAKISGAGIASNAADGILFAALPLIAAQLTRDPLLVALAARVHGLPWLLFELVSGFVKPTGGTIRYEGRDITGASPDARSRLGVVRSFQNASLFPTMTPRDVVSMAGGSRSSRSPVNVADRSGESVMSFVCLPVTDFSKCGTDEGLGRRDPSVTPA